MKLTRFLRRLTSPAKLAIARGAAQLQQGQLDTALVEFTCAIQLDPESAVAYAHRAGVHLAKMDLESARRDVEKAIELDDKQAMAYGVRAAINLGSGQVDAAIADATKAVNLDGRLVLPLLTRARGRMIKGDLPGAAADAEKAVAREPALLTAEDLSEIDGAVYNELGKRLLDKRRLRAAIAAFSQAIRNDPKQSAFYNNRGFAYSQFGQFGEKDKAIADYSAAIQLDPRNHMAYGNMADIHGDLGQFEDALADNNEAVRANPNFPEGHVVRGVVFQRLGRESDAASAFSKAIELGMLTKDVTRVKKMYERRWR